MIKQWYLNQINVNGTNVLFWDYGFEPLGGAGITSSTGWTVGKIAANNYSDLQQGTERATGTFSTTVLPNTTAPTADIVGTDVPPQTPPTLIAATGEIGTLYEYTAVIPAGTWTIFIPVIAVSSGGDQDGRIIMRVFKAKRDETGDGITGAVELTSAALTGTTVTNLTTTTEQISSVTWSAPEVRLENEFIFTKIAWNITGAGGANNRDVLIRYGGTNYRMQTPNFRARKYNIN